MSDSDYRASFPGKMWTAKDGTQLLTIEVAYRDGDIFRELRDHPIKAVRDLAHFNERISRLKALCSAYEALAAQFGAVKAQSTAPAPVTAPVAPPAPTTSLSADALRKRLAGVGK